MNIFINKVQKKYNYDEKTTKALLKIIPAIINYYGKEYEYIIYEAVENCKIIICNSFETIMSIINKNIYTKEEGQDLLIENDNRYGTGLYFSSPQITYKSFNNKYEIDNINRKIILAHTYNLDSPKGLEILTYCLCSLIKSYVDEYKIEGNNLIRKTGLLQEKRKIIYNNEIILDYISSFGTGIEKGINVYDTDKIVSMILKDEYKCYEYNSLYEIVLVLKEKLGLKKQIENTQIENVDSFSKIYDNNNSYEELLDLCDECMRLEQNMVIYDITREEKDKTALKIKNKLNNDIYLNFIEYLKKRKGTFESRKMIE